jgi:hypothetical protein
MAEAPTVPPLSTFVLRFWRDWTASGGQWRGRIDHLQSGQAVAFLSWQQIVGFVELCGILVEDGGRIQCSAQTPGVEDETHLEESLGK